MGFGINFNKLDMTGVNSEVQNDGSLNSMIARKNYLQKRINAGMASAKEVEEYKQLNRQINVHKQDNQGSIFSIKEEATQAPTKNNGNNAFGQVRQFLSGFSDIFNPKTSENSIEKDGEGVDE